MVGCGLRSGPATTKNPGTARGSSLRVARARRPISRERRGAGAAGAAGMAGAAGSAGAGVAPEQLLFTAVRKRNLSHDTVPAGDEDSRRSGGRQDRALGRPGVRGGGKGSRSVLRDPAQAGDIGRWMDGREPSGDESVRRRRLARALGQQQHLRARIANRCVGGESENGPAGVPAEQPHGRAPAAGPRDCGQAVRLEGRPRAERTRRRDGVRHLFPRLQRRPMAEVVGGISRRTTKYCVDTRSKWAI